MAIVSFPGVCVRAPSGFKEGGDIVRWSPVTTTGLATPPLMEGVFPFLLPFLVQLSLSSSRPPAPQLSFSPSYLLCLCRVKLQNGVDNSFISYGSPTFLFDFQARPPGGNMPSESFCLAAQSRLDSKWLKTDIQVGLTCCGVLCVSPSL